MSLQTRLSALITTIKTAFNGLDARVTDLESSFFYRETQAGRFQFRTNGTWASDSDDNYGASNLNWNEQAGGGADPVQEWEHQGVPVKAGTVLHELDLRGRFNNTQPGDCEIVLTFRRPTDPAAWVSGHDADGEMTNTTILRDFWFNSTDPAQTTFTGAVNDMHQRVYDLDFTFPADGWLSMYVKAENTVTTNRYFQATKTYLLEEQGRG